MAGETGRQDASIAARLIAPASLILGSALALAVFGFPVTSTSGPPVAIVNAPSTESRKPTAAEAVQVRDPAPAGGVKRVSAPIPVAAGGVSAEAAPAPPGNWEQALAELWKLGDRDYAAGKQIAQVLGSYLSSDSGRHSVELAFAELTRLDAGEVEGQAAVLATALGQVPDPQVAVRLANLLPRLQRPRAISGLIWSLGQNRYGATPKRGGWTASSPLADVNTSIQEREAIAVMIEFIRTRSATRDPVEQRLAIDAIHVLAFSQGCDIVDEAFAAMVSAAPGTIAESIRSAVVHALGHGPSPSAADSLFGLLRPDLAGEELRVILTGCFRHGHADAAKWAFDLVADGRTAAGVRADVLLCLGALKTAVPELRSQAVAVLREWAGKDDRPVEQLAALASIGNHSDSPELAASIVGDVERVIHSRAATLENRMAAIRSVWPGGELRKSFCQSLVVLVSAPTEDFDLRRTALRRLVELWRGRDSKDLVAMLRGIRAGEDHPAMVEQLDEVVRVLEQERSQ